VSGQAAPGMRAGASRSPRRGLPAPGPVGGIPFDVGLACVAGSVLGGLTMGGVYTLYGATRGQNWAILGLGLGSLLVVSVLYVLMARLERLHAGDWLVLGYMAALVLAAVVVISAQVVHLLRAQVPSNLGVPRAALDRVRDSLPQGGAARLTGGARHWGMVPGIACPHESRAWHSPCFEFLS